METPLACRVRVYRIGWVFVAALTRRLRSSYACDQIISTAVNARLIGSAVVVLAAVVLAFAGSMPSVPV
jgi:hypothetical protein